MASTATSLRNSFVEGKKLCGGSIRELSEEFEEEEEEGRRFSIGFWALLWNGRHGFLREL
jgi:hypothetical protein